MQDKTLQDLSESNLDLQLFEKLESILANNMIYNQDTMIIDIMKEVDDFYNNKE